MVATVAVSVAMSAVVANAVRVVQVGFLFSICRGVCRGSKPL